MTDSASTISFDAAPTPDDALRGSRVAFTGRLASMSRREAQDVVRAAGGTPTVSVSSRTTHLVIGMHGWPLRADGSVNRRIRQAERLHERWGRPTIVSEHRFLELAGLRSVQPRVRKTFPIGDVATLVGLDEATIRRWEYLGLVRADGENYDFQDIVSLQALSTLVRQGVQPEHIQQSLDALASFMPDTDRPLAQLRIVASSSGELLAQIGDALVAPDGQHLLDFEGTADDPPDDASARLAPTADEWFERALWLEDDEQLDDAAAAYRRVIGLEPSRVEAYFNLGNVLRADGRPEGAAELYRLALALDPASAVAWYNLADVQEDGGDLDGAIDSLSRAIETSPEFADAHFNLAACLDAVGRPVDAARHWRRYLQLDPASEWAAVARRRLHSGRA
ncbi:MAG: tetratricopeptide repeat protein [Phycisphaerales bacterium]|nr:tetratricopeptide repeat protein [Phycisphaerales bacterium]